MTSFSTRAGERRKATWNVAGASVSAAFTVAFNGGTPVALVRDGKVLGPVLVASPTAASNPDGTIVLPVGRSVAIVHYVDGTEEGDLDAGIFYTL
jgi:hypothetical protein